MLWCNEAVVAFVLALDTHEKKAQLAQVYTVYSTSMHNLLWVIPVSVLHGSVHY